MTLSHLLFYLSVDNFIFLPTELAASKFVMEAADGDGEARRTGISAGDDDLFEDMKKKKIQEEKILVD